MRVRTTRSTQRWTSPDGNKTIWRVALDTGPREYVLDTFDRDIAAIGWEGEVQSYIGKNGKRYVMKKGNV